MACHCQQDELYASEREAIQGPSFESVEQVQQWVDDLRESDWWERNFPEIRRINVHKWAKGTMDAAGLDRNGNAVVPWWPGWGGLLMLHEVCHCLAEDRFGSVSHDPWFCRMYAEAVYTFLGSEAYLSLTEAFKRHGVDYDTDNMTPGGRFAL